MTRGQPPSRRVIRQRRFVALAAVVVLLLIVVVVVRAVAGSPSPAGFVGTWEGSDKTLGSATLKIAQGADSSTFVVRGLRPSGVVVTTMRVGDDGKLTASGTTAGGTWQISLALAANGNQVLAEYTAPGGASPILLRFTRAPS